MHQPGEITESDLFSYEYSRLKYYQKITLTEAIDNKSMLKALEQ